MNLLESLRTKLESIKGTHAIGTFVPEGKTESISFFVMGWRVNLLPGRVVVMSISSGSIYIVDEGRWEREFTKISNLATAEVTPA